MKSYLKLIIGPMYSGKSTNLLSEINKYKNITDKILVINNVLDNDRYERGDYLKTHDSMKIPALMLKNLNELNELYVEKYNESDIIFIDESQFFDDLYDFVKKELFDINSKKMFIVAGLSGDYNMNMIGDIIKLVPLADNILKLSSFCIDCNDGTLANFTKRIVKNDVQIVVGTKDVYKACCRYHFLLNDEINDEMMD